MSMSTEENKRIAARSRVLKSAKIYRVNGVLAMDATLKDISATGCRIICKDQMLLPNEMVFVLPSDGTSRNARVAWRRGELAGIEFTSEPKPARTARLQDGSMF